MLLQLVFVSVIIFTVSAVDIKSTISKYPELQQCARTFPMFDASAKLPSGILSKNWVELGHFDQCLAIDEVINDSKVTKGKYCLVKITLPLPMDAEKSRIFYEVFGNNFLDIPELEQNTKPNSSKIEERMVLQGIDGSSGLILGWCVPHTCPIDNLTTVLTKIVQKTIPNMEIFPLLGGQCQTKDDLVIKYNTESIIFITFLCTTLFLVIASTLYDVYIQYYEREPVHIVLIAFSLKTNGPKLLTVEKNPDQMPCLIGIRFLSRMWDLYAHRVNTSFMEPVINMDSIKDWSDEVGNMYVLNAQISIDSFYLLSGVLDAYGNCLAMHNGGKFNIISYYLQRIMRLTPILAVVVWFHVTILEYFGSGPLWPFVTSALKEPCTNYWWATLIHIQNYYPGKDLCIIQSWYLAVDVQLFILSPLIIIPLWKWPKQTMFACGIFVLVSMAIPFAITYVNDLPAFMSTRDTTTHTRFGPWLIGLMFGYYLFTIKKNKNNRITLKPLTAALGWIIAIGVLASVVFSGHDLMTSPDKLGNSFFNGLHRDGWALGLCWIIYACTQGYGGPVNYFLCWAPFQILGRFNYSIYLTHLSLLYLIAGASKTSSYFSDFHTMYAFWGDLMITLLISVCLTLAYDSPMIIIEKVLFKTGLKSKKSEPKLPAHPNLISSGGDQTKFTDKC